MAEESRGSKIIKSAYDSETFDRNGSFKIDRKVGSATISPSGRDIALASTDGLDIIDLDSPWSPPRHLRHGLPWLVADVQWSPFAIRDYWVVSTANQKALVWNLNMQEDASRGAIEHTLSCHKRAITDINFSAHHPDMLATCAVDGYVHCWDLRRPRQPAQSFCDWFGGATQVKYNRQDSHIIASSHDRWLRIWDDRKGATPLKSINAHESKIYGIDWNRTRSTGIVTCSLDRSIRFWDYGNELDEPERIIRTDFPVWRARHTPFGWGLLAMPQNTPGELHLYERRLQDGTETDSAVAPVATFDGHGDYKVKEFLWRTRGGVSMDGCDNRDFQLVSWGEDNMLRLHHVEPQTFEGVGFVKGTQVRKKLNVTRHGAAYKTFRTDEIMSTDKKAATVSGPRQGVSGIRAGVLNVGMKGISMTTNRSKGLIRAPAMKIRDKSSKGDEQNQKQIDWMSGVKFSKAENAPNRKRSNARRLSLLTPEFNDDEEWDAPESLQDEIVRIHSQLPKITFDDVNVENRTLVASLNGPWGTKDAPIHIQVTVNFPDKYPVGKPATFTLGKTHLMPDQTHTKLKREVQQIADRFALQKKGCLEATLCYLLGEVDLDASTSWLEDTRDADDELDILNESSSDEDDEGIPAGASAMMSQELDSSGVGEALGPVNRNANVPRPNTSGARFSASGKLVCFFPPPKEEKMKSLLETLVTSNNSRPRNDNAFETFGRLQNNSSPQPIKTSSITSGSKSDSEGSDDSDASYSSDSDSTRYQVPRIHMSDYFRRSVIKRSFGRLSPTVLSQRSSGGGTNTGTGTGTGFTGRTRTPKYKNRISLYDVTDMLPSKQTLAAEYAIFGDGPDVCKANALVAEKHGYDDLADIWRYVGILLHNEVPLEILDQMNTSEPVLVVAKSPSAPRQRRDSGSDSGVDLTFDARERHGLLSGRVKWGASPLAKDLIQDLFRHFERQADVQMLAMLSCVFIEPSVKDNVKHIDVQMSQPQTPLTMKTPAFSLDYFPTDTAAWSTYKQTPISSTVTTPKLVQTPSGIYGSYGSSNGAWGSDPASTPYSCGETPPHISTRTSVEHLDRQTQSLSTSPDNARSFKRVNSGIASTFTALSRPFSLVSQSPPNPPLNRKRPSPVENMINSITPSAITWGHTTVLGSVKEQAVTPRSSYSEEDPRKQDWRPTVCTGIKVTMENQGTFDDEGCMIAPLLEPTCSLLYATYRKAYADLLFLWGHPLARLEVLKFNGLEDPNHNSLHPVKPFSNEIVTGKDLEKQDVTPPSHIDIREEKSRVHMDTSEVGLDARGYCTKHELPLLPPLLKSPSGGAVGRCERCDTDQRQLKCTVCLGPVVANYVPCFSCNCVTHRDCLQLYHEEADNTMCSGGCDCDCSLDACEATFEDRNTFIDLFRESRFDDAEEDEVDEFETDGRSEWEKVRIPGGMDSPAMEGLGSVLSKKLEQVRTGDWSLSGVKKRASSLRNFDTS